MKPIKTLVSLAALTIAAACAAQDGEEEANADAGELNLYSSRHYDADMDLYAAFTEETGVKVNLIEADADALVARIQSEGEFSPADILLTVDAGRLWRAEEADIFAPVDSDTLNERVPAEYQHPEKLWYGFAARARVIIHNNDADTEALKSYADLANPIHKGKVCMRSSSNIYNVSLVASLISHLGSEAAEDWARGVVANFARAPQANDTGNIEAVASGQCAITIANSYYLARLAASDDAEKVAVADAVTIVFPNQDGRGAHVNISGAGLLKHSPNKDNAIAFMEFMTSEKAQTILAEGNHEYPLSADVAQSAAVNQLGTFKRDTLDVSQLGVNQTEAVQVLDRAGWK